MWCRLNLMLTGAMFIFLLQLFCPFANALNCYECKRGQMGCHRQKMNNKYSKECTESFCNTVANERKCASEGCKENLCNKGAFQGNISCTQCSIDVNNPKAEDEACRTGTQKATPCGTNTIQVCRAFGQQRQCADENLLAGDENACIWEDFHMPYDGVCCLEGDDACNKLPLEEVQTKAKLRPIECFKCKKPENQNYCADGTTEVEKCKDGIDSCVIKDGKWGCGEKGVSCTDWEDCCPQTRCNANHYCYSCKGNMTIGADSRCDKNSTLNKCEDRVKVCRLDGDNNWGCARNETRCGNLEDYCCDSSKCNSNPTQVKTDKSSEGKTEKKSGKTSKKSKSDDDDDDAISVRGSLGLLLLTSTALAIL